MTVFADVHNHNTPGLENNTDAKQSDTGTSVKLEGPSPASNAQNTSVAPDPCDNKECDAACNNAYAYGCVIDFEDGVASGYANSSSDGYNHAATLMSDDSSDEDWDEDANFDSGNDDEW